MSVVVEERKHFPVTPYPALIERGVAGAALAKHASQCRRVRRESAIAGLQKTATLGTVIEHLGNCISSAAGLVETQKVSRRGLRGAGHSSTVAPSPKCGESKN